MANFLSRLLAGTPGGIEQVSKFQPNQLEALNQLLGMGQQNLQNPLAGFEPLKQQAISQFNQQTVPGLAERFSSLGSSSLGSPQFASQLGQAGAGLSENLAAMGAQFGQQNIQNALQQLQMGLTPQFETSYRQSSPGLLQTGAQNAAQYLPLALGSFGGGGSWLENFSKLLSGSMGGVR